MGRSWSSVYGKLVLGVWKELRLTGRGGRRGEKGYSDSREQECVVTIKQAGSEGTVEGGRQGRQGTEAAYFASSGPKRQKKMTRRMGKLEKTRKGRLGKDCEEWDTYDSLQGDSIPWESGCGH